MSKHMLNSTEFPEPLPNLVEEQFHSIDDRALFDAPHSIHRPRVLMLYGSLRERSYSRLITEEAARILGRLGAEVRIFNPAGLPLPDSVAADHPKVRSCAIYPCGPRPTSGARQNGMAR